MQASPPGMRKLGNIRKQTGSRYLTLDICDYWGFSQHERECWVDTIQQIFFFTDGLKELTQPLFYKMTDEQLHSSIERAIQEGIIQTVALTSRSSTPAPTIGDIPPKRDIPLMIAEKSSNPEPIIKAIEQGNTEEFLKLFKNSYVKYFKQYKNMYLWVASKHGQDAIVRFLLENGADVNTKNGTDWTALMCATVYGHASIVHQLLEKGADVNIRNNSNWTPLMYARYYGQTSIVQMLLEKGADVETRYIQDPPKAGSSFASIIEEGIKAMRDRFKNHYNTIIYNKPEICLIKGPQKIKQMYESSVTGPILLKRLESTRLGPSVAAGLQSLETQQKRLNIGKGYSEGTTGGKLNEE